MDEVLATLSRYLDADEGDAADDAVVVITLNDPLGRAAVELAGEATAEVAHYGRSDFDNESFGLPKGTSGEERGGAL